MQEGKKQRIEFLDYLKAVCVIMVIITHYGWEDKTSPFFTMLINMAVPVFMIVSGYNLQCQTAKSRRKSGENVWLEYDETKADPLFAAVFCHLSA